MFGSGPARRFAASLTPGHLDAASALPGGTSADPTSPFYLDLLRRYLTNDYYPALLATQRRLPPGARHASKKYHMHRIEEAKSITERPLGGAHGLSAAKTAHTGDN